MTLGDERLVRELKRVALALAIGAVGGAVFKLLNLPLAWMLGAMCLCTVAALGGAPVRVPPGLRATMVAILGVMLGSVFTPEIFARAGQWLGGVTLLVVYVGVTSLAVLLYMRKVAGYDPVTAYFAATPGGLNEMTIVGEAMGGDPRVISLTHAIRILVVVLAVPFYFRVIQGYEVPSSPVALGHGELGAVDALVLGLCALAGYVLAVRLRLPAAQLVGPMLLSAAVHLSGLVRAAPPTELVAVAQVVVGTAVGCRFAGISLGEVRRIMVLGFGSTALMLAMAGLFAKAGALAGAAPMALFLSFAPGGLAEMSLIALALGIDTAFVSTMHIFRIVLVVVVAPLAFRLLGAPRPHS